MQNTNNQPLFFTDAWRDAVTSAFPFLTYSTDMVSVAHAKERHRGQPFTDVGAAYGDIDINEVRALAVSSRGNYTIDIHTGYANVDIPDAAYTPLTDYFLPLSEYKTYDDFYSSRNKSMRYEIRNSKDVTITLDDTKACVDTAYRLYLLAMRDKENIVMPRSLFTFLYKLKESKIYLATEKQKTIGCALFLEYEDVSHYFLSAVDPKYRSSRAGYALLNAYIQTIVGKKDLWLGAARTGSQLARYKASWGGIPYPIIRLTNQTETLRESKLRRFWRKLPLWLIEPLSLVVFKRMF